MKAGIFLLIFLGAVVPALPARAREASVGGVVINEIAWMGSPVAGVAANQQWRYEWLELFNAGDAPVFLGGWTLELRSPSTDSGQAGLDFAIPLAGGIPAKGYFLVVSSGKILQSDLNYANLGGKFSNSGQQILLKNAAGIIQDEVDAKNGWFGGENKSKRTMERIDALAAGSAAANWKTSQAVGGTPRAENSKKPAPLPKNEAGPLVGSAFLLPSHFLLALIIAVAGALAAVSLRRFLLKRVSNSFGVPGY